jgi:hypothetical protein
MGEKLRFVLPMWDLQIEQKEWVIVKFILRSCFQDSSKKYAFKLRQILSRRLGFAQIDVD